MDDVERMYRHLVRTIRANFSPYLTQPFEVGELYQTILPYRLHRRELGLETNQDYELALMELLTGVAAISSSTRRCATSSRPSRARRIRIRLAFATMRPATSRSHLRRFRHSTAVRTAGCRAAARRSLARTGPLSAPRWVAAPRARRRACPSPARVPTPRTLRAVWRSRSRCRKQVSTVPSARACFRRDDRSASACIAARISPSSTALPAGASWSEVGSSVLLAVAPPPSEASAVSSAHGLRI